MLKSKKLVIGNWKMLPFSMEEAKSQIGRISKIMAKLKHTTVVVAPSFVHIAPLSVKKSKIIWGAQNVFGKREGSATGEVSVRMLKDLGVEFVIVGHSERRALGETNEVVATKTATILAEGLKPVLCVGEKERDLNGNYLYELQTQLLESVAQVKRGDMLDLVIAYEPVWAIGATTPLDSHEIHMSVIYIRKILSEHFSRDLANAVKILYGGTVTADNAATIIKDGGVDGLLVGRESLKPEFAELLRDVDKV